MGKLRLDFDDLVVESFSTGREPTGSGTVQGRAAEPTNLNCNPNPTRTECNTDERSCFLDSCWDPSCGGAMVDSCGGCFTEAGEPSAGCESADGQC